MSTPERMKAIRRLFLAKLEKMPSEMKHEMRIEMARKALDKDLGMSWRDEVKEAGPELDPTGDMLPKATRDEGYHGDDVPEPVKNKKGMIKQLIEYFHGK